MTGRFPICQGEIPKEGGLPSLVISVSETGKRLVVFNQILYQPFVPSFHLIGMLLGFQLVQHDLPERLVEVVCDEAYVKDVCAEPWPPRVFGITQYDAVLAAIIDIEVTCLRIGAAIMKVEPLVCRGENQMQPSWREALATSSVDAAASCWFV